MEQDLTQYVNTLFTNMKSFSQDDRLIGKPVTQGDKTFLPVISVTLGYGGGDSQNKGRQNGGNNKISGMMSDAVGVGAKLCTDAIIVIDKDNVMLAPVGAKGGISQLADKVPQILGSMSGGQQNNQQQQQQQNQQQSQGLY